MATAAALLLFDGRDIADASVRDEEVTGYVFVSCPVCGTERDARYPYCCELAVLATTEPVLATV